MYIHTCAFDMQRLDGLLREAHELDREYQDADETSALAEQEVAAMRVREKQTLLDKLDNLQHEVVCVCVCVCV